MRQTEEAGMWSGQKPQPQHDDPQVGEISQTQSIFLKKEVFENHIRYPQSLGPAPEK